MRVQPKVLVRRLSPVCTGMLEAAVGRAATGQYYEIVPEHLLHFLVNQEDGDVAQILQHFGQDRLRLMGRIDKVLEAMKTGNAGRPTFAESLFQWIEDAWTLASLLYGVSSLRTGHLLLQFAERASRYSAEDFPEIEAIDTEVLRRDFDSIVFHSNEMDEKPTGTARSGGQAGAAPGEAGAPSADSALGQFTVSLTREAREGRIDPIFGRHREIRQCIDILARRRKNNPIIVGEPGVGKTALVEGLALAIVNGDVPDLLKNVELVSLDMGLLQAGASVKGEFEKRLRAVISEVKASPTPMIMFIDEAHTIIGAGGQKGGSDASNLLKPALARGELRTVAATTWSEYKKYFEKDPALERRFQPVKCDEPSVENAIVMLRGLAHKYEQAHGVTIRDEAVVAAAELSGRYISGRQLPDKAVDLLDTAAARVKVEQGAKPQKVEELELELASLNRQRIALDRDIAEHIEVDQEAYAELLGEIEAIEQELAALTERWQTERDAVLAFNEACQNLRDAEGGGEGEDPKDAARTAAPDEPPMVESGGEGEGEDPDSAEADAAIVELRAKVEEATNKLAEIRGEEDPLVHHECDADVVAKVVASWTGIPVGKMKSDTISSVLELEGVLGGRVKGQEPAVQVVSETVRMSYAGVRDPNTPIGVLLFVGTSGVGKTEMALSLADQLYGGDRFMTTINMSEFQEKHTVSRLIGSPPGYVGYGEGGMLTEAVRQRPYSVVLLDECEKADPDVMNLFYQVFDKGMLNDGEGRNVDFKNTIIILTSNLASDTIMRMYDTEEPPSNEEVIEAIRPSLSSHFKPALLARMTIVPFRPIGPDIMREIAILKLGKLRRRMEETHGVETTFSDELLDELVRRCTDADTGARNVDHTLRASLMPALARTLLEYMADGEIPPQLEIGLSPEGDWRFDFS
ncbi:type VI secretion system ATPase TssH [Pseudenhygromyxa sp. WMMC2535]|uniref:type VI secretion system ATPase TssH n=1 Tax=Pseudenhygromyxa sp. WMMC2535 TaxID=2712867 RepID=UPI001553F83F|nr:type VI secretion system ATPase TssH [Pseudenhygromyxa sp. WMMC2535]NVB38332.1 type VI secretion system ATPase TssH [Pseudenhygromyxa sp. WMMC2535]